MKQYRDHRSAEAKEYRKLYSTARWRRLREYMLAESPLCQRCLTMDVVEPATVVHHASGGHKGNIDKFWNGPFEVICASHHNSDGQREDLGQTIVSFGRDGWPV